MGDTFWFYDDTTSLQYMMYQTQPSGTTQSEAGPIVINFYSDTIPAGWDINSVTSRVYFYVQTTGNKTINFDLRVGSGSTWTFI